MISTDFLPACPNLHWPIDRILSLKEMVRAIKFPGA
jgi:hypothetical protein